MPNQNLHQLIYCSRNLISGSESDMASELQNILASARVNNKRIGVTGALLYTDGNFAQILEGPLKSIEQIFEVIQCDHRHSEVTVIHSAPASERNFPEWAMAFAGSSEGDRMPDATAAFHAVFENAAGSGEQMLGVLRDLVVREDDWDLLDAA